MNLKTLTEAQSQIVGQVLRAAADGPFFPDWEFATLFGLERADVRKLARDWPAVDRDDPAVVVAVNNAFNNVLGYPHGMDEQWPQWITVDATALAELFAQLRG